MTTVQPIQQIDTDQVVAANLRAEMSRQRWTGRKMAAALGLTPTYVNRRTKGETILSPSDLVTFASLLNIPVSRLFMGTQNSPASEETGLNEVPPTGVEPATYGTNVRRFPIERARPAAAESVTLAPVTTITGERVA